MREEDFNTIRKYLIGLVVLFVAGHLFWEYSNGGVSRHYLLHSSDLPAISNWWSIGVLPLLAWFSTTRMKRRVSFHADGVATPTTLPKGIALGFFGMMGLSVLQSASFELGYEAITMSVAGCILLMGLVLPIYRAECILGYVLGATFTFGPVIPLMGILVMAAISAFSNLLVRPVLARGRSERPA